MQGRVGFFHDFFGTNSADVGQVRAGRFRELGHRIFHDFLATQVAENTDDVELPIPPSINYAGQPMLAYKPHKMIQTT